MNIKDLIVPFVLALLTWWGIQYFFMGNKSSVDQYKFTAPQSAVECKPLDKEIEFSDAKRSVKSIVTHVETSWGNLEFSTEGAILNRLEFKRVMDGKTRLLGTIFPSENDDRENRAFLVGLKDESPFYYRFIDKQENDDTVSVSYEASTRNGTITKTFVVYKDKNRMDLNPDISP